MPHSDLSASSAAVAVPGGASAPLAPAAPEVRAARDYWARQLADLPHVHNVPLDRLRPARLGGDVLRLRTRVDASTLAALERLGTHQEAGAVAGLQAALAVAMARESGESDIVVGVPRAAPIRAWVVRNDIAPGKDFLSVVRESAARLSEARAHDACTWEDIVAIARAPRTPTHAPVYQIELRFDDADGGVSGGEGADGRSETTSDPIPDLRLHAIREGDGLALDWIFAVDVFGTEGIGRIAGHFNHLLLAAIENPTDDIWRLPMMGESERRTVLYDWNETAMPFEPRTMHAAFAEQVAHAPDAVALCCRGAQLRYAELDARANALAHHLVASGVAPGSTVGVCLERTLDMVVGMFAALKAGAAYVPLDPDYPQERIAFMLADSGAACVLTQSATATRVGGANRLDVDDPLLRAHLETLPTTAPDIDVPVDALAYIIYTSGSTGMPKGVCIEHRQASAFIEWVRGAYDAEALSGVLAATSICFDLSIFELFATLSCGGCAILVDNALDFDGIAAARGATLINTVPSALRLLLEEGRVPESVRVVNLAGEALPPSLVREIYRNTRVEAVFNLYGPSEDTTYSTWARMPRDATFSPIGRPIGNGRVYVLDRHRQPVPIGVAGEIYVAGAGIARGYWNRPELTAERFMDDPFRPGTGARMYRTGDLGRWLPNGELEYLGRIDHQIKLRGFRVELGEIQERLGALEEVDEALVVANEASNGDKRLVGYVVPARPGADQQVLIERCKAHLGASLPAYMVPQAFVVLEVMPLTPNGKVDRSRLPEPEDAAAGAPRIEPRTATENALAALWRESLHLGREVGADDDFFELGGHSLVATRMLGRVQQVMGIALPLKALFEAPTLAEFARAIERETGTRLPELRPLTHEGPLPLSFPQRQLWFIDQLDEGSAHYNLQTRFRIKGSVDPVALRTAVRGVVRRHESLRTVFGTVDGESRQWVRDLDPPFRIIDAAPAAGEDLDTYCDRIAREEALARFELGRDPMLRATLVRVDEARSELLLTLHHIAGDGWSLDVLMTEVGAFYRAAHAGVAPDLPPLPLQYADYARWQELLLHEDALGSMVDYWVGQLEGVSALHNLPLDRPRPRDPDFAADTHRMTIDAGRIDAFRALCRSHRATLSMGLQTLFAILLARHSGERDIAVGVPIANREHADLAGMIGLFTNTVILRSDVAPGQGFLEHLERGRRTALDIYSHQQVPIEKVVERLKLDRDASYTPLTQIVFALQNTEQAPLILDGMQVERMPVVMPVCAFELMVEAYERSDGLAMDWFYRTSLFERVTIAGLADRFVRLLDAVLAAPADDVWRLPMLGETERRVLIAAAEGPIVPLPDDCAVHRLFQRRCADQPDAPAIVEGDRVLTYGALDARADALARSFREAGAGPGATVAIAFARRIEFAIAALAALKTGAAYLPIDPEHPKSRIEAMLDAAAEVLAASPEWLTSTDLDVPDGCRLVDRLPQPLGTPQPFVPDPAQSSRAQDPAYVIYTSGSTGEPKGVINTHRGLANLCAWYGRYFALSSRSRCTFLSSPAFDASVLELWSALLAGACLIAVDADTRATPALFRRLLREHGVTHAFLPTGLLEAMADADALDADSLEVVSCGGDRLHRHLLASRSRARFVNLYGPSETAVVATACDVPRDGPPPIGRPIDNACVYVLDAALQPQPFGVTGELYIGGACVGRGYFDDEERTRERFLPNPFDTSAGSRLYRTGDLARRTRDGRLEFIGRDDQQVKLRGFRIELGEIENRIRAIDGVQGAVVMLREDRPGQKRLVAYAMLGEPDAAASIRLALRESLPEYMRPHALVPLSHFPLTTSGKIDYRRLPPPAETAEETAPATPLEKALAALWAELLGLPSVGVTTNFFEAGGQSLLITRMIHQVAARLRLRVSVRDVYQNPTVRHLAAVLAKRERIALESEDNDETEFPLSAAQFRVWYVEQTQASSDENNIPADLCLRGPLDADALQRALDLLVERHAMLRTRVSVEQGVPMQRTEPACRVAMERIDLSALEEVQRQAELERLVREHAGRTFDAHRLPLLAVMLIRLSDGEHRLQLNIHHLVFDGWSFGLFREELMHLYAAVLRGDTPPPRTTATYAGHVRRQRAWLESAECEEQSAFWRDMLAGCPDAPLTLPGLKRWPATEDDGPGARIVLALDPHTRERLAALAGSRCCSLFSLLYSAFVLLLARLSGRDDFNIGIPVNGRGAAGAERIIGNFLNNLPIRNRVRMDARFVEHLDACNSDLQRALSHQELPFEHILRLAPTARARGATPLFQVFFNMMTQACAPSAGPVALEFAGGGEVAPKFDLTLYVNDDEEGTEFTAHFDPAVYVRGAIGHLMAQYLRLLEHIVAEPEVRCGGIPLDAAHEPVPPPSPPRMWEGAVQERFLAHARRCPDAPAILAPDRQWTYGEVLAAAFATAASLHARGVRPGDAVAVVATRGAGTAIAAMATLFAGAAFSMLDPDYPVERVVLLHDLLDPACVLYAEEPIRFPPALVERLAHRNPLVVAFAASAAGRAFVPVPAVPERSACVTFTSGTSGVPKLVVGVHIGLAGYLSWMPQWLEVDASDRFSMLSGLGHDPIQRDIFTPLCNGACMVIPPPQVIAPHALAEWLTRTAVTFVHLTPAMAQILCTTDETAFEHLRVAFLTGEPLRYDLVERLRAFQPRLRVLNSYGTTETQRAATYFEVPAAAASSGVVPAGEYAPDTVLRVLDADGRTCAFGEIGDLHLESHHLSEGYRNDPARTAEVFRDLGDGLRRYRTGDIGCRLPNGQVAVLGRKDGQLNLRGFRIETGEIETLACRLPEVREAAALLVPRGEDDLALALYVVPDRADSNFALVKARLATHLAAHLPAQMAPSAVVMLECLPMTPNAKLDRRALPAPEWNTDERHAEPRNALDAQLAALWSQVLGIERIGIDDDFFSLGGHSMLMVLLLSKIRATLGRPFDPTLFACTTIRQQANALAAKER